MQRCRSNMFAATQTFAHHLSLWGIKSANTCEQWILVSTYGDQIRMLPPEQSVELDITFNLSSSGIKSTTLSEQDIKWGVQIYKYMPVGLHRLLEMRNPFTIPGRANVRVAANMFSWNPWRNKVRIGFPISVCLKMEYIFSWFKKSCSPLQDCHRLCASSSWLTKQPKKGRMSHCQTHPSNISWYPWHTMDGRNLAPIHRWFILSFKRLEILWKSLNYPRWCRISSTQTHVETQGAGVRIFHKGSKSALGGHWRLEEFRDGAPRNGASIEIEETQSYLKMLFISVDFFSLVCLLVFPTCQVRVSRLYRL